MSEPVRLGEILPAVLADIESRINRRVRKERRKRIEIKLSSLSGSRRGRL